MTASTRRQALRYAGGWLLLGLTGGLAACGFQLRQRPEFAFRSIYTSIAPTSLLGSELRRNLAALGNVRVITEAAQAQDADVMLDLLQESREKAVVGFGTAGQVREFQLRLRVRFRLRTPAGKDLIADAEILQQRDMSFNESATLAKEAEEALLYRNMQTDVVHQILRRLAAVREL